MASSLYDAKRRVTSPLDDLMGAVFDVNWHLHRALREGWVINLDVMEDTGLLGITVKREDEWPTDDSEADAGAA